MALDPHYQDLFKQTEHLRYQVHDAIDDRNHPSAHALHTELEHLENDIQGQRHPRDVENRVKNIQRLLIEARSNQHSYMSVDDADHFHRTYEGMRQNIRKFNNY
ncbi:MAG TPA: hypothetical protein VFI74_04545 [Candidatus Saccharimonadales bacterium]|nr:hypothetical protein [Candidatus Saccharimonadales bacterium]